MPALLPGYEYDIFISYRHNDNRSGASTGLRQAQPYSSGQGWVTEFVNALQEELAATIKEPLTIYFDKNPHDGLLETHSVDKSLEGKLKCLIFIPIISQTYCDPKSFAWQHEFCAFNRLAKEDQFGRDVKLGNGNVASRILPIKIHDLDADDKTLLEKELGGALRAVEFIYKEPGVNRPLKLNDHKADNLNKTDYRNQVNKVANAIKETITSLRNPSTTSVRASSAKNLAPSAQPGSHRWKVLGTALFLALAATIGYYFYGQGPTTNDQPILDKSIAVLAFTDMSPGKDQEYLGDGIAEEILNVLARVKDLKVIGRTSSFSYKGKGTDLKTIGQELGVSTILEGSIRKDGNKIRITAQFIKASDGSHLWSESYDRELKDIFDIQDELAKNISNSLLTTFNPNNASTKAQGPVSNEAYNLYLLGKYQFDLAQDFGEDQKQRLYEAINTLNQSIELDSGFTNAYSELAKVYLHFGFLFGNQEIPNTYELGEKNVLKALSLDPKNAEAINHMAYLKRNRDWDWEAARRYYLQALTISPNSEQVTRQYSLFLSAINEPDSAMYYSQKALDMNPNSDPNFFYAGRTAYYARRFEMAEQFLIQIKEKNVANLGIMIGTFYYTNEEKAVSLILENSQISDTEEMKLQAFYKANGWNFLMKELNTKYRDRLGSSMNQVYFDAATPDEVLDKLEKDLQNKVGSIVYILVNPRYDRFRTDPRFNAILKRMGLDKYK